MKLFLASLLLLFTYLNVYLFYGYIFFVLYALLQFLSPPSSPNLQWTTLSHFELNGRFNHLLWPISMAFCFLMLCFLLSFLGYLFVRLSVSFSASEFVVHKSFLLLFILIPPITFQILLLKRYFVLLNYFLMLSNQWFTHVTSVRNLPALTFASSWKLPSHPSVVPCVCSVVSEESPGCRCNDWQGAQEQIQSREGTDTGGTKPNKEETEKEKQVWLVHFVLWK